MSGLLKELGGGLSNHGATFSMAPSRKTEICFLKAAGGVLNKSCYSESHGKSKDSKNATFFSGWHMSRCSSMFLLRLTTASPVMLIHRDSENLNHKPIQKWIKRETKTINVKDE